MARQFIYHMHGLSKAYPGNRKVLEDINLSFYPDAKIGVLGVNGSGKSTLLRIMAGHRHGVHRRGLGRRRARASATCRRSRSSMPTNRVRENVMEGVAAAEGACSTATTSSPTNYSDETADEMTKLQDEIEAKGLWDLDSKVDLAMDALRCPPDDAEVDEALGRRAAPRRALPAAAGAARPPAARRADQPSRRRDRWPGSKATCATIRARS